MVLSSAELLTLIEEEEAKPRENEAAGSGQPSSSAIAMDILPPAEPEKAAAVAGLSRLSIAAPYADTHSGLATFSSAVTTTVPEGAVRAAGDALQGKRRQSADMSATTVPSVRKPIHIYICI